MKIGIHSKFHMAGGSEFRCIEMANAIKKELKDELSKTINPNIKVIKKCFQHPEMFYEMDCILVVNTDSKEFTQIEYWESHGIRVEDIRKMVFLFNFIVSPAQYLWEFVDRGIDVRILTGNKRFYDELSTKDKHSKVARLPRMILESPINQNSVYRHKTPSNKIRIGKHSKPLDNKWNEEHLELINSMNEKHGDKIIWDFMGGSNQFNESLKDVPNVILRPQFMIPVPVYLMNLDIYLFYLSWKRQECWARSVGEAMASGCPILATDVDGGNKMQVIDGSNGFLCENHNDFKEKLDFLINNPDLIKKMGKNSMLYSKFFSSEEVTRKFLMFIED